MRNYFFLGLLLLFFCFFNESLTARAVYPSTKVNKFNIFNPIPPQILGSGVNKVVIDAGHGGYDGGTSGSSTKEKDITLRVALMVGKSIQDRFPEVEVLFTRKTDVFVPLSERARIANEAHADLFISIHCNAMPASAAGRKIHGSETYVLGTSKKERNLTIAKRENETIFLESGHAEYNFTDPDSPEWHIFMSMYQQNYLERSIQFADLVERKFATYGKRKSRGVLQNNFHVLREVAMPSVLIETGYLSNRSDEDYLKSKEGQAIIIQAISDAFYEYKTGIEEDKPMYINQAPSPTEKKEVPQFEQETIVAAENKKEVVSTIPASPKPTIRRDNSNHAAQQNTVPKPFIKRATKKRERTVRLEGELAQKEIIKATNQMHYEKIKPVTDIPESKIVAISTGKKVETAQMPERIEAPILKQKKQPKKSKIIDHRKISMSPVFKIQIAASKRPINVKTNKYANLSNVEVVYESGYFKYLTGHTRHWSDITSVFKVLKNKGFNGFIVAYLNGQRIGLQEARNMVEN